MDGWSRYPRRARWAGLLVGFALGGFFDGILLHQILQWHHLLSLVDGVGDLRNQVLFDGLFHLLMYLIGFVGLVLLVRSRTDLVQKGSGRMLFAGALLGFGAWHAIDGVLSHWVLGIHRIKLDSPNPLAWDVAFLLGLGVLPAAVGLWLARNIDPGPRQRSGSAGRGAATVLALLAMVSAFWAAQAPADNRSALVVFGPNTDQNAAMHAIVASEGSLLWEKRGIWAVRWADPGKSAALYRDGAWLVSNSFLAASCLGWTQG